MPPTYCKFVFRKDVSKEFVENSINCAIFLAEFTFGKARVRLDAAYTVVNDPARCLIDVSTEVGRFIAEEVADTMIKLRGERSFEIFKVDEWKL